MSGPAIGRAQAWRCVRVFLRAMCAFTKSAWLLGDALGGMCMGLGVAVVAYGAIVAPDSMWASLGAAYRMQLEPYGMRTIALLAGVFGLAVARHSYHAVGALWAALRSRAPVAGSDHA